MKEATQASKTLTVVLPANVLKSLNAYIAEGYHIQKTSHLHTHNKVEIIFTLKHPEQQGVKIYRLT